MDHGKIAPLASNFGPDRNMRRQGTIDDIADALNNRYESREMVLGLAARLLLPAY
jgi:hypothetical protein